MTKILVAGLLAVAVTTVVSASPAEKKLRLSVGAVDYGDNISGIEYSLNYTVQKVYSNNILFGFATDIEMVVLDDESSSNAISDSTTVYGLNLDIKCGYQAIDSLALYGLGSFGAIDQSYGYGGGVGFEYTISEHISTGAEYKYLKMTAQDIDLDWDYKVAKAYFSYNF